MAVAIVELEVDKDMYFIEIVTNFGMYLDLDPPEKLNKRSARQSVDRDIEMEEDIRTSDIRKHCKDSGKERLFALIYKMSMSARAAGQKLQINPRTCSAMVVEGQWGRPALLDYEHKKFLLNQLSLVLDQMIENLTTSFIDLETSKTALYNFVANNCRISLKRAQFYLVDRNSPGRIKNRKEKVEKWTRSKRLFGQKYGLVRQ
ncbi:hypothetical protein BD408DRAFT_430106 [Parasitella parasitica]|nr:hypothetical protein BD408DRAFT_430106 [Parasitella parasitica]